ncbi:hypothetical protein [Paenibacillus sp. DCT19]|uniref:hypothetical protein n=1 Tax=Paenibacillus sp. DCT19 TaxID=2211212 RepID=UPI000FE2015A|nr:hypothetical protein [Paenibacillus sp. DCT19]
MAQKRHIIMIAVTTLLLLICMFFLYKNVQENQRYEQFISAQLNESLSELVTAILANDEILQQYTSGGRESLLPEQATNLCANFTTVSTKYNDLLNTAIHLNKVTHADINPILGNVAQDITFFLARSVIGNGLLGDCSMSESTISLDATQSMKLTEIRELNNQWSEIVKKYVPEATSLGVSEVDWNDLVNHKMWIQLLEELSVNSEQSGMTGINRFFN